ncbi:MAG: ATP synthase subunit I [Sideroxydans sp.]|nr:ATP synthase subunit I [Sideroxydans sp.]
MAGENVEDSLTPPLNAAIIAALQEAEALEKKEIRRVTSLQVALLTVVSICIYIFGVAPQYAIAVLSGGGVSVLNSALMAWRMTRANQRSAHDAHLQLRLLYFYAAERFLAVVVSLGLCMAMLKLPLAVLGGFVLGQAVLLTARLFLRNK